MDHDDLIPPHALYMVAREIVADPDLLILYSDEDQIDRAGRRHNPYFKPDWNIDLLLGQNTVSHLGVYRTDLLRGIGGFRKAWKAARITTSRCGRRRPRRAAWFGTSPRSCITGVASTANPSRSVSWSVAKPPRNAPSKTT